jgi:copper(I)-binding protein/putative intracellular protease/amidase
MKLNMVTALPKLALALFIAWIFVGFEYRVAAAVQSSAQSSSKTEYVCPPCGCDKDGDVFASAGACTSCGMALVEKGSAAARPAPAQPQGRRRQVAILIFDGVQIIDYTGPYEVFGQAGFDVFTVAEKADPITTAMGMKVTPTYSIEDAPEANILVVPGGGVIQTQNNAKVLKWIQETSAKAEHVMSVCNGAYILAKAGLLDNLTATTFHGLLEGLATIAPKTRVVSDRRFVDNGKIITTAGLSSGIDGSLHLISKIYGRGRAQMIALNLEYNWQPDFNYARAALADMRMRFRYDEIEAVPLNREGDRAWWENRWLVRSKLSASALLDKINETLSTQGKWNKVDARPSTATSSMWKFTDEQGKTWNGSATVEPLLGEKDRFIMVVKISRSDLKPVDMAGADKNAADKLIVKDAWIQEAASSQQATAAFMVIENQSARGLSLVSAKVKFAATTELHKMEMQNELMRMRKVDLIAVPAGESTKLDSSTGYHLMFIGLNDDVKEGSRVPVTLQFSDSTEKTVLVAVKKRQSADAVATKEKQ